MAWAGSQAAARFRCSASAGMSGRDGPRRRPRARRPSRRGTASPRRGDVGGARAGARLERDDQVAGVEAAGLSEDRVVARVELRELALAARPLRRLGDRRLALALLGPVAKSGGSIPSAFKGSILRIRRASRPAGLPRISWRRRERSSRRSRRSARRSAAAPIVKKGSRPASSACSASRRSAAAHRWRSKAPRRAARTSSPVPRPKLARPRARARQDQDVRGHRADRPGSPAGARAPRLRPVPAAPETSNGPSR